jgi:cobalt/nickel transport system permease protein
MHIPDAFIPIPQGIVYWVIALVFVALALRWARRDMHDEKIPLVGVLAAGIFAIQTMNMALPLSFIPGGASGHVVGAALAAIVLGSPYAGVFILTLVLVLQAVVFGDGGITAMGVNIINMGVLGGFFGYYTYRSLHPVFHNHFIAAFAAGWISLFLPAIACATELAFAGTFPLTLGLVMMGMYHAVIGLLEGAATAFALSLILAARPDIIETRPGGNLRTRDIVITAGIIFVLAIAIAAPFAASVYPDGLESAFYGIYGVTDRGTPVIDGEKAIIAERAVVEKTGNDFSWQAPFMDYRIPGLEKPGEVIAILIGGCAALLLGFGVMRVISRSKKVKE